MEIVESWWNLHWGDVPKRRIRLCEEQGHWCVEIIGPSSRNEVIRCTGEAQARKVLRRELTPDEIWWRVDHLVQ